MSLHLLATLGALTASLTLSITSASAEPTTPSGRGRASLGLSSDPSALDPRARGQARAEAYLATRAAPAPAPIEPPPAPRSAGVAIGLSIGVTAAGVGMLIASSQVDPRNDVAELGLTGGGAALILAGPSAGRVYLGRGGQATLFTLARAAGATAAYLGPWSDDTGVATIVGAATLVGLSIYDVASLPSVARARRGVTIAPMTGGRGAERQLGLVATGSF